MAKYDVAARFQEVAKRARETGPIHTGAPKKKMVKSSVSEPLDEDAYDTRPGRTISHNTRKDINLPIDTRPKRK